MLSPLKVAQPNSSYPALCRQGTTSPWSTDYGGNISSETLILILILMQAMKTHLKENRKKKTHTNTRKKKKKKHFCLEKQ